MSRQIKKFTDKSIYFFLFGLIFILFTSVSECQNTYRVFFKDKGNKEFKPGSNLYNETVKLHNQRCIERRRKVLAESDLFSIEDAPVCKDYIDSLLALKVDIKAILRWNNYVVIACDSSTIAQISAYTFIKFIQTTGSRFKLECINDVTEQNTDLPGLCGNLDYGASYTQLNMMKVPPLHKMGITGKGVLIGFLDSGFRWRAHKALKNINVISEHDFVFNDNVTANQDIDTSVQDNHGTAVLSTVAGFAPGQLIGVSPSSDFMLAKTEYLRSETQIEEDYYAEAIEWMESQGVDITSSSLGYGGFDFPEISHVFDDYTGHNTICSIALNKATERGVVCVTAAGNKGPTESSIHTPGDADSAITVAALNADGIIPATFSSRGPVNSTQIKPNIATQGVSVAAAIAYDSTGFNRCDGTSFATPLLSGTIGLMLSVFPELRPWEVKELLYSTASQHDSADYILGYGRVRIYDAMIKYGIIIAPPASYQIMDFQRLFVYIDTKSSLSKTDLFVKFSGESNYSSFKLYRVKGSKQYFVDIPLDKFNGKPAIAYIEAEDLISKRRYPFNPDSTFAIVPDSTKIPCGIDISEIIEIDKSVQNAFLFPNFINGNTGTVTVTYKSTDDSQTEIEIFNSKGQSVQKISTDENYLGVAEKQIDISSYASGAYFLRISTRYYHEVLSFNISR